MKTTTVNTRSGVPLWRQIADALIGQIRSGDLAEGDQMPSYREIAATWNVGPSTAMSALADLRRRGLISGERGQASRVLRSPHIIRVSSGRYSHSDDRSPVATDLDSNNHSTTLRGRVGVESASRRIAARLDIAEGDPVSRVDYYWEDEKGGPIQRSTQWEPLNLTRGTSAEIPPENGEPNVISRMAAIGVYVTHVDEQTESRMPTAEESEELQIDEGIPVLHLRRTHFAGNQPVETARITIRGDRVVISTIHQVSRPGEQ